MKLLVVLLCLGLTQAGFVKSNFAYSTIQAVQPIIQPVAQPLAITYSPYPFHLIQPQYYHPLITAPAYFGQHHHQFIAPSPVFGAAPPVQQEQQQQQQLQQSPQVSAPRPETVNVENDSITVEAA